MFVSIVHYSYTKKGATVRSKDMHFLGKVTRERLLSTGVKHRPDSFRWSRDGLELYTVVRNNRECFRVVYVKRVPWYKIPFMWLRSSR